MTSVSKHEYRPLDLVSLNGLGQQPITYRLLSWLGRLLFVPAVREMTEFGSLWNNTRYQERIKSFLHEMHRKLTNQHKQTLLRTCYLDVGFNPDGLKLPSVLNPSQRAVRLIFLFQAFSPFLMHFGCLNPKGKRPLEQKNAPVKLIRDYFPFFAMQMY